MAVRWEAVAGGLLTGIGRGINEELEYKRQLALQQAELEARARERAEERQFRAQEREADRQFEREKLSTQQQFQREMADREFAQRKELMEREYGMRDRLERSKAPEVVSGLTTEEKNLLQQFIDANTVRGLLDEEIDWEGVQRDLIEAGHTALAAKLPKGRKRDDEVLRAQARKQAEEEAEGRKSFWRPRSIEFPETQGSEEEWINRRVEEILGGRGFASTEMPQSGGGQAGAPPGRGTRESPYRATTQEHIDWFKQNAPAGSVIEVNGQLYTK